MLAELDTTLNFLRYDDPYDPAFRKDVLPQKLLEQLEATILVTDLGYKFVSYARRRRES